MLMNSLDAGMLLCVYAGMPIWEVGLGKRVFVLVMYDAYKIFHFSPIMSTAPYPF